MSTHPLSAIPSAHADGGGGDFADLSRLVRRAGLLDRRHAYYAWKIGLTLLALAGGCVVFVGLGDSWWQLGTAVFFAVMFAQLAFLGHDAGHKQIFRTRRANDRVGYALGGVIGISYGWWMGKHTRHHANPNHEDEDPDLAIPILAFTREQTRNRRGFVRWTAQHQAVLFFPLLLLEGLSLHWASIKAVWHGDVTSRRVEAVLLLAHVTVYLTAVFLVLSPPVAIAFIAVHQGLWGVYMGCSFAPGHKGMPTYTDASTLDFLRKQVLTSRNVRGGRWVDVVLGGLNYQIEHHLFPTMPRVNLRRAQPLVRAFCAQRGIDYAQCGLLRSYGYVLAHLHQIGAPLRAPDSGRVADRGPIEREETHGVRLHHGMPVRDDPWTQTGNEERISTVSMRVIHAIRFGGPEVLVAAEAPEPNAGPGQVVVAVSVAEVLFIDTQLRSGWGEPYFTLEPPYVPGTGVAGTVVSTGEGVDPGLVGRQVIARTGNTGGYAQRAVALADEVFEVPDGLDPHEALASLHDGLMAVDLVEKARIQPGERVLVGAAGGSLGTWLVPLAHAAGAQVIATARGERKLDLARRLGADIMVDYSEATWPEHVREATGGAGIDVVFDGTGGQIGRAAFGVTAHGGRFFAYGAASGDFAVISPHEAEQQQITVIGIQDGQLTLEDQKRLTHWALSEIAAGRIHPVIGRTFPLEQAAAAHAAIEARGVSGKTLLLVAAS